MATSDVRMFDEVVTPGGVTGWVVSVYNDSRGGSVCINQGRRGEVWVPMEGLFVLDRPAPMDTVRED